MKFEAHQLSKTLLKSNQKLKYKNLMTIGYEKNKAKEKQALEKSGYYKDTLLSGKKDKVYVDKKTKQSYVVYKGTDPTDWKDLATDAAIAVGLGRFTPRFKNAKKLAKKAKAKYGESNTIAVGHSLGGSLATESGLPTRVTFNKGVGIGGIGKQMRRGQIDYRTVGDVVSLLSKTSKYGNKSKNKSSGAHLISYQANAYDPLTAHALQKM